MKVSTIIKCIDYRQDGFFKSWLKANGMENSDIISVAGSVKELVGSKDELRNWLLSMVKISHDGHGSRDIILTSHSTCGAYAIEDLEEEKRVQLEDLEKAKKIIEANFPDMKIRKFWLELVGTHEETTDIVFNEIN